MSNTNTPSAVLRVDKDGWTQGLQISIGDERSGGFRLAGPKYNGSSSRVIERRLTQRDADEIRRYLDRAFPQLSEAATLVALDRPIVHGQTCPKAPHDPNGGYLHDETDDGPYDVDGVRYCGRCHQYLP